MSSQIEKKTHATVEEAAELTNKQHKYLFCVVLCVKECGEWPICGRKKLSK